MTTTNLKFNFDKADKFRADLTKDVETINQTLDKMERVVEDSRGWWNGSSQEAFVRKFVYLNKDARRSLERRLKEYDTLMSEVARVKAEDDEKVGGMLGQASQDVPLRAEMRGVVAAGVAALSPKSANTKTSGKGVPNLTLATKRITYNVAKQRRIKAIEDLGKNPNSHTIDEEQRATEMYTKARDEYNEAFLAQFDLGKIYFMPSSTVQSATIRNDCKSYVVGENITEEEYRFIIAIIDNETNDPEVWLGVATTILNATENEELNFNSWLIQNCHPYIEKTTIGNTEYDANARKEQILAYMNGDSEILKHPHDYGEMKEILDWTLSGNRIFPQEVQFWQEEKDTGREVFGTFEN